MAAFEIVALDEATPQLRAPGSADTYLAPRAMAVSPPSLTGAAVTPALDITQTWNTTGAPSLARAYANDTASAAGSLLLDLGVGVQNRFAVHKSGRFGTVGNGTTWMFDGNVQQGFLVFGRGSSVGAGIENEILAVNWSDQIVIASIHSLNWSSAAGPRNAIDLTIVRDAPNTLALRRGTNGQTFRAYGTFTDASNNRRVSIGMTTAGVGHIRPEGSGTGASGNTLALGTGITTVANLPTAASAGSGTRLTVSDANATTFNSIVAGGGANTVPVFSDGTNWRIG